MENREITARIREFADGADPDTLRETLDLLIATLETGGGTAQLEDAFYRDLDFGTGGLRGTMGPGTNRMNRLVVAKATQGLVNYVANQAGTGGSICIAYDSRLRSAEFARVAAGVIAASGLTAYVFDDVRPTPELSFAVRKLGCTAGIVITASHNPKEYNGYKVSWSDGAQVVPPHDRAIIDEVRRVKTGRDVKMMDYDEGVRTGKIRTIGSEIDEAFLEAIEVVRLRRDLTQKRGAELRIVYTPLHGTGGKLVPRALKRWGFSDVRIVPEQAEPDGNFPTTKSPNPEEQAAMQMALDMARREEADVVFATDPDADRLGIAVKHGGSFQLMTGNQVGALLAWYICDALREEKRLPKNGVLVKTIVTSELIAAVGEAYGVGIDDCLTGFKYIGELIRRYEEEGSPGKPSKTFLMGCEESYGYLVGTHARDKDSVVTSCVMAEMALWAKTNGRTLVDLLHDLFARFGVFMESQLSRTMPGVSGMQQISDLMKSLREDPPRDISGIRVAAIVDVQNNKRMDLASGREEPGPGLPKSNVLIFRLEDGSSVIARPSGTEPKIKFYFMVVDKEGTGDVTKRIEACSAKRDRLMKSFGDLSSERTSVAAK